MRYDVKKFLFFGLEEDRDEFFRTAQQVGIIHFIDGNPTVYKQLPEEIERIANAIKIVRSLPVVDQEEQVDFDRIDEIVDYILHLRETIDKNEERLRILRLEVARVGIFGHFSKDDVAFIEQSGHRKVQFYCAAPGKYEGVEETGELIYVGSEFGLDYFVGINREPTQYPGLIELKIDKPLGELNESIRIAAHDRHHAEERLKTYARFNDFLHEGIKLRLNKANLNLARSFAFQPMENSIFAVEGWVPSNKINELRVLLRDVHVYCEEVSIEEHDPVPTYLENKGTKRIGEDLIGIYDTPSPTDKDPSVWVLCFFALFFAMIVGDGGYGLVFLAVALYCRSKFKDAGAFGKRFINLMIILATACIMWGVLNTSFFGINIGYENPLRHFSLVTWLAEKKAEYHVQTQDSVYQEWVKAYPKVSEATTGEDVVRSGVKIGTLGDLHYTLLAKLSDQIFLELVLLIAVVHISLSMLRYIRRTWAGIGWIPALVGAWLYVPFTFLGAITFVQYLFWIPPVAALPVGLHLVLGGFVLAVALAIIQHRLLGLVEIMAVIQIFADVMSYLRLYALGLAGSIVSATLNEVAVAVPFVVAVILIGAGHIVNMLMAIASGVIHGLRLNFLEWYHYSFTGGGRPFRPLHLLEVTPVEKQNRVSEENS